MRERENNYCNKILYNIGRYLLTLLYITQQVVGSILFQTCQSVHKSCFFLKTFFSAKVPIILCLTLARNRGAWGMWACLLFFSSFRLGCTTKPRSYIWHTEIYMHINDSVLNIDNRSYVVKFVYIQIGVLAIMTKKTTQINCAE